MRGDESNLDARLGAEREGMEGVANLKRTVRPGFAHNMTFEQGHEKVRANHRTSRRRAFQAKGIAI